MEGRSEAYELPGVFAGECHAINGIGESAKGGDHAKVEIRRSRAIHEVRTDSYFTVKT